MKRGLGDVSIESGVKQFFQDSSYKGNVLFQRVRVDLNVIQLRDAALIKVLSENVIDIPLQRSSSVCQSKRHNIVLEVPISGSERGYPFVSLLDPFAVVRRL